MKFFKLMLEDCYCMIYMCVCVRVRACMCLVDNVRSKLVAYK